MQYAAIDATIAYIHEHISESLSLSQLARYAAYSPYHFTRLFKERVGLPPLYYVSSMKFQRAKELLVHTDLSVRGIGLEIGQQSVGTFTTRFTERVGMTPARYRASAAMASEGLQALQNLNRWNSAGVASAGNGVVTGTVQTVVPFQGVILIGLFPKPIPEGLPLYGTVLAGPGPFAFHGVRAGTYYLLSTAVPWMASAVEVMLPLTTLCCRLREPIVIAPGVSAPSQKITLGPPALDDPPILISLPLLMHRFLARVLQDRKREESGFSAAW